jgi:hypothetical protein
MESEREETEGYRDLMAFKKNVYTLLVHLRGKDRNFPAIGPVQLVDQGLKKALKYLKLPVA